MKKSFGFGPFISILAVILLFAGCHTSKRPVLYGLLGEESPVNLSVLQKQYPEATGVYLFYKRDISHDLKPDFTNNAPRWYFFESYHWREMVLDPAGDTQRVMDLAVAAYEEIRKIDYQVTQPDGTEVHFSRSDLKKEKMGGDSTRYYVDIEALPAGSIVEATYEIERGDLYKNLPLSHDVALELEKPALDLAFAYTYPWHWQVQVKQIGQQKDLNLSETESDDTETKTLHYSATQVPAFNERMFGPYLKEVAPYFHVQVNKMEIGNVLVYEAPDAWDAIAGQYASHAEHPGKKVEARAGEILNALEISDNASEEEKIEAILNHVQNDIAVASHGSLEDVIKKQRGDAYAVTSYTKALLDKAGVASHYLVAHSAEGGVFDPAFITDQQLYRPLLLVTATRMPIYLFPSLKNVPSGYIPSEYEQQPALSFNDEAFEGFTTINMSSAAAFADKNQYEIFINSEGETRVKAELMLGDHSAYQFLQQRTAGFDERTLVGGLLPHDTTHVSGLAYHFVAGSGGAPARIKAEYALENCVKQDGGQIVFKTCGFFDAMHRGWASYKLPRRISTENGAPATLENKVTVHYPAGWTLLTPVNQVAETVSGGRFTRSISNAAGLLKVDQTLVLEQRAVQPLSLASSDVINLPAQAALPMLELTSAPVFAAADFLGEIEPGGPWTLVIQSFDTIKEAAEKASQYRKTLANKGYEITVLVDGDAPGEFRLVLGTFATRTGIESAREALTGDIPFDSWMLSLKPQMTAVTGEPGPVMH